MLKKKLSFLNKKGDYDIFPGSFQDYEVSAMEVTGVSYLPWSDKNVFQRFMLPYFFYILVIPTIGLYDFDMRFTVHVVKGQKLRPENFLPLFELATIHIIQNNFEVSYFGKREKSYATFLDNTSKLTRQTA